MDFKKEITKVYQDSYPGDVQFLEYLRGVLDGMTDVELEKLLTELQTKYGG